MKTVCLRKIVGADFSFDDMFLFLPDRPRHDGTPYRVASSTPELLCAFTFPLVAENSIHLL
jgi:hypothetical protein